MPICSILGCKRKDCAEDRKMGYTFHVFPHKNPDLLKEWILSTGRKDFTPCSKSTNAPEPCQIVTLTDASFQSSSMLPSYQESSQHMNNNNNIETMNKNFESTDGINKNNVYVDHIYAIRESPKYLKRKLDKCIEHSQVLSKRIKIANQRKRRLERKVSSLRAIIKKLKKENFVSSNCAAISESSPALEKQIFKRSAKHKKKENTQRK